MSPPRKRYFNAEGIVVRARNLGEADRVVILLTPNRGLLSCVARGSRRTKSKTGGYVDLIRHITAHISQGRSDLHVISQVETVNAYLGIRNDLDRLIIASHFTEIAERFSLHSAANPQLFNLLRDTLAYSETTPKSTFPLLRLWYETTLLNTVGLQPQLYRCVRTSDEILPGDHWFSPSEGGIIKQPNNLSDSSTPIIPASLKTIKLLRHITRISDWERLEHLRVDNKHVEGGQHVMDAMLRYQQERGEGRAERVMKETRDV